MPEHTLTLLHISDLHIREGEKPAWRRRRVLGEAWEKNLEALRAEGPYDLVCFTGDVAFAGKPAEYEQATEFFQAVLDKLGLGWDRFFTVPGNHDIDRSIAKRNWKRLREKLPQANRSHIASWLAGGKAPLGFKDREREQILSRQAAYRQWVQNIGRSELDPANSPHGLLGYRQTLSLPGLPFPLHILGLDSSWMCGDNHDSGKLWLTDEQIMQLAMESKGDPLSGYRLALVHHPLEDLADGSDARRLLAERVDLMLRGHLHEPEAQTWDDTERSLRQVAAGCLYEHDRYPNACERIRITFDDQGRPLRYDLRFRGWSTRGHWYDDNSLYQGTVDGRLTLWVSGKPTNPQPDPTASKVFVGREPELAELEKSLLQGGPVQPVAICAVQGMPGVGKSYLADRFAYLYQSHFPGGRFRLVLDTAGAETTAESLLGQLADRLHLLSSEGLAERVRERLLMPRSLVHLENVDTEHLAETAAVLIDELRGCPILVCGRYQGLGSSRGWLQVPIRPFDEETALEQLKEELGPEYVRNDPSSYRDLVRALGFLPLAVHLAAGHLREGLSIPAFLTRLRQAGFSLRPADVAELTAEKSRRVIASTFDLSLDALKSQLGKEGERLLPALFRLGNAPLAGVGISLGAAIAGLPEPDFEILAVEAKRLSILDPIPPSERKDRAYRIHPLLAELLRMKGGSEADENARQGMTDWFCSRLPELPYGKEDEQGKHWKEIQGETGALTSWLSEVPVTEGVRVERAGSRFAIRNGPFHAWLIFCETLLSRDLTEEQRSGALWTLGQVACQSGDLDRAATAARNKADLDRARGAERGAALGMGLLADVLQDRGELDEALRIRREELIPFFDRIGDERSRGYLMGKIADVLQGRGELDEALRIRREEELPVYERLGDVRARAVTLGEIADVFQARGEFDEALRIQREELIPIFERLGDIRSRAYLMGKIANVLQRRGELDEALRIRREEQLPVYERLGDVRGLLVTRTNMALTYLKRNQDGDRETARELLHLALEAAERLRIPEAGTIRSILRTINDPTPTSD